MIVIQQVFAIGNATLKVWCGLCELTAARSEGNDPSHLELGSRTFEPALGEDKPRIVIFWSWRPIW